MTHAIVLPGGGYETLAAHEGRPVAAWLEGLGMTADVLNYPVKARHPVPLDAVLEAVARARADGASRVGLVGFSAGGHLAGLAALARAEHAPVDFAILGYPIVSMERNVYPSAADTLLGPDPTSRLRAETSLDRLVTDAAPPMFIWHTSEDAYVPVSETYLLADALNRAGVSHTVHVFAHGPHSLGLAHGAGEAEQWTQLAERWLRGVIS
jgi:acetyl esterase/lipase